MLIFGSRHIRSRRHPQLSLRGIYDDAIQDLEYQPKYLYLRFIEHYLNQSIYIFHLHQKFQKTCYNHII